MEGLSLPPSKEKHTLQQTEEAHLIQNVTATATTYDDARVNKKTGWQWKDHTVKYEKCSIIQKVKAKHKITY
jgi:spore coat polysaccharide biosynthesis predicted glycosyltransferase SpsG